MSSLSEGKTIQDVVRMEMPQEYCREVIAVAKSQTVLVGSPMDVSAGTLIANGSEANADAIALEAVTTGSGATGTVLAIVRGPCIINEDQLSLATDVTAAELKPYYKALGILLRSEPTKYTEGA